uniref:REJ domain-containing protein n=1 Tax=Macrostomum lignano TaxID=282301 RepID=A0A1I8FQ04_9PLAT
MLSSQQQCGRCFSWLLWGDLPEPSDATLVSGSNSLCQCTPRNATTSSYLNSLNSYTADMLRLLNEISTQLSSLGLKFSDFSNAALARPVDDQRLVCGGNQSCHSSADQPQLKQQQLNWRRLQHCVNYSCDRSAWTAYPSEVYIFTQATWTSSASLLSDSLTTSSQTGAVCINVGAELVAFSVLPKALKSRYSLMPNYQFTLTVTGCFKAIPASSCVTGNALAEISILPVDFFYNRQIEGRTDGIVIKRHLICGCHLSRRPDCGRLPDSSDCNAGLHGGQLQADEDRELIEYRGTIEEFPGSENVSASNIMTYSATPSTENWRSWPSSPRSCSNPSEGQFKFFPEARGCFDPVSSSCVARPACVGPLEVGWHSRPAAAAVADLHEHDVQRRAVCVTATNATSVQLSAIFPVGAAEFFSTNTLTGEFGSHSGDALPSSAIVYLKWTISGCFSTLPAYCLTTTAGSRDSHDRKCTNLMTLTNSDPNVLASAISGGSFVSSNSTWTVAKGGSLTLDLTRGRCRQSVNLLAICILGNAATVRVDFVGEDNSGQSWPTRPPSPTLPRLLAVLHISIRSLRQIAGAAADGAEDCIGQRCGLLADGEPQRLLLQHLSQLLQPHLRCSANYRPVFYSKRYYRISFAIVSGFYGTYKSTYASPVTSDYMDLLNMTDTMIYLNFGDYKDKYEGIDQATFTSGSVAFQARLIMYDGGYSASALDAALTAGMGQLHSGSHLRGGRVKRCHHRL